MENDDRIRQHDPLYEEARALAMTVRLIRLARGKKNPTDFPAGTPDHETAIHEFLPDVYQALGCGPDELQSSTSDCQVQNPDFDACPRLDVLTGGGHGRSRRDYSI
ncbi:hypothetical protein [Paraburkholderia caledonica]|uniref:hypothetical protein n=1 Tax=Paraburkholderia caledonica TaxID=134536 RepID=UPI0015C660B2|nr:hypothetical protein [Paraburkholderia caledonica]